VPLKVTIKDHAHFLAGLLPLPPISVRGLRNPAQSGAKFIEGAVVKILFKNANLVLDRHPKLQKSYDVLVEGDRIVSVPRTSINSDNAKVIELGGRTLMSGLIDAHAYIIGLSPSPRNTSYPVSAIAIAAANYLRNSLMDSFTSIRESGAADDNILRLLAKGKNPWSKAFIFWRCTHGDQRRDRFPHSG
jgi:hypothetical protein